MTVKELIRKLTLIEQSGAGDQPVMLADPRFGPVESRLVVRLDSKSETWWEGPDAVLIV